MPIGVSKMSELQNVRIDESRFHNMVKKEADRIYKSGEEKLKKAERKLRHRNN